MKRIFKYFGLLLSVALMGSFTACNILNPAGELEDLGLGIKVFFPTKVVAGQPMTINGSGFTGVSEIIFPGEVSVTNFEIVSNDMIRVNAPAGIAADGGHLILKTADAQAESPLPLTLGRTAISGFSVQEGDEVEGGQQITVYGTDLEFINYFEIKDPDGNTFFVPQEEFYRKGTSNLVITLPKKILEDTYVTYLHTYDQQTFALPELTYKQGTQGGHWESQEITIWDTETVFGDWSATIVIGPEQFANVQDGATIRVYVKDKTGEYNPIFKHVDNWADWNELQSGKVDEDGYFETTIPADALAELQASGLRFQGVGFTITKVTILQDVWIDGEGHWEKQQITIWDTETVFGDWSATIVIGPEKFADVQEGATLRVYVKDKTGEYNPIFKHVDNWADWNELQSGKTDGEDYFEAIVPAEAIAELQTSGLRFQGIGFTITKVELIQETWIGGGGHMEHQEISIWDTETVFGDWSATIVIAPEQFANVQDGAILRVYVKDKTGEYNPIFKHVDSWADWNELQSGKTDGEDYFEAVVPAEAIAELQASGLRFQGVGFTITKVLLIQDVMVGGDSGPTEYDIAPFTMFEDRSDFVSWPYYPSWSANTGKWRIMRGIGDPTLEAMGLTTSSKFVVYKEVGTTGQIQWNDPNWTDLNAGCNDWDGSAETIEVPITEDMLKCINGEVSDGWSDTAIILQGDGLTVTKIVIVP